MNLIQFTNRMTAGDIFMMLWQKIPFESYEDCVLSDSQFPLGELEIALRTYV